MRVIKVTSEDMNNGPGLRVVLWVSGCEHHCDGCHNTFTWNSNSGKLTPSLARLTVMDALKESYIEGITYSGGDPLHPDNIEGIVELAEIIHLLRPKKNQWLYTGYTFEQIKTAAVDNLLLKRLLKVIDVICDGKFDKTLVNPNTKWVGSSNQRIIDVQKSLKEDKIILVC